MQYPPHIGQARRGACTYDVCTEGREGVSQFLTKGSEVAWIGTDKGEEGFQNPKILSDVICTMYMFQYDS